MDFSILYRVLWKPHAAFKHFGEKPRLEPFIFVALYAVLSYLWYFKELIKKPGLFIVNLLQGLSIALLFPVLNAAVAFLILRFGLKVRSNFLFLMSVFILCGLPYYIEGVLIAAFGYDPSIGLGSLVTVFGAIQPFLFGMIAIITPFFIWIIFLWRAAINQLFDLQRWQSRLFVGSLVLINMLFSGAWRQAKCLLAN